jgi:hypothetical protein
MSVLHRAGCSTHILHCSGALHESEKPTAGDSECGTQNEAADVGCGVRITTSEYNHVTAKSSVERAGAVWPSTCAAERSRPGRVPTDRNSETIIVSRFEDSEWANKAE